MSVYSKKVMMAIMDAAIDGKTELDLGEFEYVVEVVKVHRAVGAWPASVTLRAFVRSARDLQQQVEIGKCDVSEGNTLTVSKIYRAFTININTDMF